jgi:hypothetical protein
MPVLPELEPPFTTMICVVTCPIDLPGLLAPSGVRVVLDHQRLSAYHLPTDCGPVRS